MYERPFVTGRFTAYEGESLRRTVSLAVLLTDEFTGGVPVGTFQVLLKERRGEHRRRQEPIRNQSGFFCFLDIPDGNYNILVEPGPDAEGYYLRPPGGVAVTSALVRQVSLPLPNPREPVVELRLTPTPSYRFPGNATLVRGRLLDAAGPIDGRGVVRCSYERAAPNLVNPDATANVVVDSLTDKRGQYVLFFSAPSPAQQAVVVGGTFAGQSQDRATTITQGRTEPNVNIVFP